MEKHDAFEEWVIGQTRQDLATIKNGLESSQFRAWLARMTAQYDRWLVDAVRTDPSWAVLEELTRMRNQIASSEAIRRSLGSREPPPRPE